MSPTHLPLALTLLRLTTPLALVPMIVLGEAAWRPAATVLFTLAALSDSLDGWLARRWDQVTVWGEVLDPLADKFLVLLTLLALLVVGDLNAAGLIFTFLIFARELAMAALRDGLSRHGSPISVSVIGKIKTALTYTALCLLVMKSEALIPLGTWLLGLSLIPAYGALGLGLWQVIRK